jgi:hypothetical protein
MYSVLFIWPSNDVEEECFQKYANLEDAFSFGHTKMQSMPGAVMCVIVRPGRQSVRIWWDASRLVSNLPELKESEPSLAQKLDWRKYGF